MARTKSNAQTKNDQEKLTVVKRHRVHFLEEKIIANNNGPNKSPYLKKIQEGPVYANLDDIEEGKLYMVCELSNGLIVLNKPTMIERLKYFGQLSEESGLTVQEIKKEMGLE